jgi:2-dehydro-3-deoxy-D-gluconate 5-dehydrogenase
MQNGLQQLFGLSGKTAIVTGGGRGIGQAIAWGLATAGAHVVIAEIDGDSLATTAAEIQREFDVQIVPVMMDVRDETATESMLTEAAAITGAIDILVNNAGLAITRPPEAMSLEEWDLNMDVNLRSVFRLCRQSYPYLKRSGDGRVINIGSMYAIFGASAKVAYAASKGGLVQLTKSLAIDWAIDSIRVNAILPGWIVTALSERGRTEIPGLIETVCSRTPAGRWGEPEDVAGAAVFLAGPAARFITGATLAVDGGYSIR